METQCSDYQAYQAFARCSAAAKDCQEEGTARALEGAAGRYLLRWAMSAGIDGITPPLGAVSPDARRPTNAANEVRAGAVGDALTGPGKTGYVSRANWND